MFKFPSSTKVEQNFKLTELLKMIKADKVLRTDAQNILSVQMTNAISEQTTGLHSSEEVNEIYVMKIMLNSERVPSEFIKALDKTIRFQVLYEIHFDNKVKFLTEPKTIKEDKLSILRLFESEWEIYYPSEEMPLVGSLTELYKLILTKLKGHGFRAGENIASWIQRVQEIEKTKKEFAKIEKLANTESQPKKKFEYNAKLREIYDRLKGLKETWE
ncbi:MAG: DUF4391 domain-containing protein [Candidatus Caccovivens sp.]